MALPPDYFQFWVDSNVRRDREKIKSYNHQRTLRRGRRRIAFQRALDLIGTLMCLLMLGLGLGAGFWIVFRFVIMKG